MKTRFEKTKTPETKFLNVYVKREFSRESSISQDSGISDVGSLNKRRLFEFDLDINIKTEAKKKIKIEKSVVNPFALKTIFKKENKSPENTVKVERKPIIAPKIKTNEPAQPKSKCTIFNVNYKTFQIKKCTIQIEKCEELETAKKNRSPELLRRERRINKNQYSIVPAQFLSLQPKVILFRCQSYTWRSIRDDDWTFPNAEINNSKLFSGTFNENITFRGQIKCRNIRDGKTFYFITYYPKDVIEDEWISTEQNESMNFSKTLPLKELKTEAKRILFENLFNDNKPFVTSKKSTRKYIK